MSAMKRIPVIPQMEELEGGASCLAMILAYWGKWVTLDEVRSACGIGRDGISIEGISHAATDYGLIFSQKSYGADEVLKKATLPVIIQWHKDDYAILYGGKKGKLNIIDPNRGRISVSKSEFEKSFNGVCIELKPGPSFVSDGKRNGMLQIVQAVVRDHRNAMLPEFLPESAVLFPHSLYVCLRMTFFQVANHPGIWVFCMVL
jgi:ABC-type bacteriocin/lantibiotic exporter with double-glycine peptidase domain